MHHGAGNQLDITPDEEDKMIEVHYDYCLNYYMKSKWLIDKVTLDQVRLIQSLVPLYRKIDFLLTSFET